MKTEFGYYSEQLVLPKHWYKFIDKLKAIHCTEDQEQIKQNKT